MLTPGPSDLLTFNDLIELYVIKNLRRVHGVSLRAIRSSIEYAESLGFERVLLSDGLATMDRSVFFDHLGQIIAISRSGQVALREIVQDYLVRLDRSPTNGPILHPDFVGEEKVDHVFPIAVSPVVAFGQPTITGTAIKTRVVAARVDAGESVEEVAEDYGLRLGLVTNAVVFENAV